MRSRVQMLKNVPTDATTGGAYDNYGIIVTTRGRLRRSSGNRALTFGEIINDESYELILRYQQAIENDLAINTKFLINGLVYSIDSWEKFEEINFYYRIKMSIHKDGSITVVAPTPISSDAGVKAIWLTTNAGDFTVSSNTLIGKTILGVEREGIGYTLVIGTPVNRQVSFSGNTLTFDSSITFNSGEIVYVLYKTSI